MMRPTIPVATLMVVIAVDLAWTKSFVLNVSVTLEIYVSISIRATYTNLNILFVKTLFLVRIKTKIHGFISLIKKAKKIRRFFSCTYNDFENAKKERRIEIEYFIAMITNLLFDMNFSALYSSAIKLTWHFLNYAAKQTNERCFSYCSQHKDLWLHLYS